MIQKTSKLCLFSNYLLITFFINLRKKFTWPYKFTFYRVYPAIHEIGPSKWNDFFVSLLFFQPLFLLSFIIWISAIELTKVLSWNLCKQAVSFSTVWNSKIFCFQSFLWAWIQRFLLWFTISHLKRFQNCPSVKKDT